MDSYYKYIWIFVMEEITGNIGVQAEKELYELELELYEEEMNKLELEFNNLKQL